MPRRGLGPAKKRDAKGESRRQIARPRSIAAASLEEHTLTEAEQATNSTDSRVLASGNTNAERAVDGSHIKTGSIADAHVNGQLNKTTISGNGRWGPREISVPGLTDNPDSDAGRAVDARSFADRNREVNDALASRATNAEVNNALNVAQAKTSAAQVKALIRKHVKKNSTQGL